MEVINGEFSGVGLESTIDVQYIAANAPGNAQRFWSTDASDWIFEWTQAVLARSGNVLPGVFSISYVSDEKYLDESGIPVRWRRR